MSFPLFQWVKFRMLPKANKNTFLVSIDMPAGTVMENTDRVARAVGDYLLRIPEVKDYETFVGHRVGHGLQRAAPGRRVPRGKPFCRHPGEPGGQGGADASRARSWCSRSGRISTRMAQEYGANIKLVEDPPGPPVRATVVAEIYGPDYDKQRGIAQDIKALFAKTDQVVDIDDSVKEKQDKYQLIVDKEKAALAGVSTEQIVQTLRLSVAGMAVSTLHRPDAKNPVSIMLRLPKGQRTGLADMDKVYLMSRQGSQVPLSSLITDRAVRDGQGDLSQEPRTGHVRVRRDGCAEPGVRGDGHDETSPEAAAARGLPDQVGRRNEADPRRVPRPGRCHGRGPDRDLPAARGPLPVLHDPADHHGLDPALDDRHHARASP